MCMSTPGIRVGNVIAHLIINMLTQTIENHLVRLTCSLAMQSVEEDLKRTQLLKRTKIN